MKTRRVAKLKHHALAASTPTDPQFGDHLTFEQINALTAPSNVAWVAVSSWLSSELPAANVTREGSHFDVVSSVSDVSQLFSTQFEVLVNINTQQAVLRAKAYTVPLEGHVANIFGLHGLPLPPRRSIVGSAGDDAVEVTPDVLTTTYGISGVTVDTQDFCAGLVQWSNLILSTADAPMCIVCRTNGKVTLMRSIVKTAKCQ